MVSLTSPAQQLRGTGHTLARVARVSRRHGFGVRGECYGVTLRGPLRRLFTQRGWTLGNFFIRLKISNETSKRIRVVTHFYFFDAHSLKIASTGDHWMTINPMSESVSKRTYEVRFPDTNALKSVTGVQREDPVCLY